MSTPSVEDSSIESKEEIKESIESKPTKDETETGSVESTTSGDSVDDYEIPSES